MENQKSCKPKFNIENYLIINKKPHYISKIMLMRNRVNRELPVVSIYLFTKVTFHVKVHMYIRTEFIYSKRVYKLKWRMKRK